MHAYVIPVAPSVTEVVTTLVTPNDTMTEHSIIVTCTVHPDSNADMCVVMAMAVGRTTREGTYGHTQMKALKCDKYIIISLYYILCMCRLRIQ